MHTKGFKIMEDKKPEILHHSTEDEIA